jgi:hypothetical protein
MKIKTTHEVAVQVFQVNENVSVKKQTAHPAHELWSRWGGEHESDLT